MACAACAAEHEQAYRTASRSELEQSHEFRQIAYLQAVGGPSTPVGGSDPTVNGAADPTVNGRDLRSSEAVGGRSPDRA